VVLGLAVLAAACGGDDDDANARQDYVDAVVSVSGSDDLTQAQSTCFAEAVVDAIGVEELDKATSPRGIRDEETSNMVDLGVKVTTEEAKDFYERINRCVDLRQIVIDSVMHGQDVTAEAKACLDEQLTDDLLKRFMINGFTHSLDAGSQNGPILNEISAAFDACAAPESGTDTTPTTTAG
jgi:hypothetical protein